MNKQVLKNEFIKRYLKGEGVSEYDLLINDENLLRNIIKEFKSWSDFERELGLRKRHLKERNRFFLYWKLKLRKERFGSEVLRPKNIEEDLKEEIIEEFGTLKKLVNIIKNKEKEALFYEAHAFIITGGNPKNIQFHNYLLHSKIINEYGSLEKFYEEYEKYFIVNPLKHNIQDAKVENEEKTEFKMDIDTLLRMGYINEKEAEELKAKIMDLQKEKKA